MEFKTAVILLFGFIGFVFCDLHPGDPSVCEFTDLRPKYRVVNVTYVCEDGKKICQRTNKQRISTTKYICCDKYKFCYDKCIPEGSVCAKIKCVNARYTGSDNCTCDVGMVHLNETHCGPPCPDGLYNDLNTSDFTCISKCSQPCVNGNCTDYNSCTCNLGLVHLNETHCGPLCPNGFYNDLTTANFMCKSKCSHPCVNGNCTDYNSCTCNIGMIHFNETHCAPPCSDGFYNDLNTTDLTCISKCSQPCVNGKCTDFNSCTCNLGLVHLNETHCAPPCSDGFYNDPNTYELTCISKCSQPCVNGKCTDFNSCTCNLGLVHLNETHCAPPSSDGFYNDPNTYELTCISKCSQPCVNGKCADFNSCTCNLGMVHINETHCGPLCRTGFYSDRTTIDFTCKSKCSQPCTNGSCADFEKCTCDAGYKLKNGSQFECQPECIRCENGACVEPNKCNCNKGYTKNDSNTCVPVCSNPCNNGYCSAPEICKCNSGYSYDDDLKSCVAVCKDTCINSSCVSPDRCACWTGYVPISNCSICKPYCSSCDNGECVKPYNCRCNKDYERLNDTCMPIDPLLRLDCLNHLNETLCLPLCSDGFYNDPFRKDFACTSKCSQPCVNGKCTDFDKCTCNPGLEHLNWTHCGPSCPRGFYNDLTTATFMCKSKCSLPCVNGNCTDFNSCTCNLGMVHINETHCGPPCPEGFYYDFTTINFTCKSKCSQTCIKGSCTDFENCKCYAGYRLKIGSIFECQPECIRCENGACVEPNKCRCNKGYTKNHVDLCIPVCSSPCNNGYCSAPDTCDCFAGYSYDEDVKSCVAVCKETCLNSSCVFPDKCECWKGYINSNDDSSCTPYCSSCNNGYCIGPELCNCNDGYERRNNICEASPIFAGFSWILVGVVTILLFVFLVVMMHYSRRGRDNIKHTYTGRLYNVLYSASDSKKYHEEYTEEMAYEGDNMLTDLHLPRVSSQDYIEKL